MSSPPSTRITLPVSQCVRSSIKAAIACATSCGVVSRPPGPQPRTVRLEAEVFDLMDKWIERYRRQAEERYRRLDAVLAAMNEQPTDDCDEQKGSAA